MKKVWKGKLLVYLGLALLVAIGAIHFNWLGGSSPALAAMTSEQIKAALAKYKGSSFTIASWGGTFQEAQRKAFFKPFSDKFGIKIIEDSPCENAKIVAMVKAKNVTWDVVDAGSYKVIPLGKAGILEELDYSIIDKRDVVPGFAQKWGIGNLSYSAILAYRTDAFPKGREPSRIADLWDVKRFPGKRAIRDTPIENLAYALEADGVPYDQIYPLTEDKIKCAYRKLDELKPHVAVWWMQGAQAPQLLTDKEVVMATAMNGRIDALIDAGLPIKVVWDGAELMGDSWLMPKGTKNRELAMLFIAWATLPENNWKLSKYISYGPVNKKAFQFVPKEKLHNIPTTFYEVQVPCDFEYWGEHFDKEFERWREWKLK